MRASVLLFAFCFFLAAGAQIPTSKREPAEVRIGVLSLLHPHTLLVSSPRSMTILLDGQAHTLAASQQVILSATPAGISVRLPRLGSDLLFAKIITFPSSTLTITVPDKLARAYRGVVTISVQRGVLIPIVAMPTEIAVASIVAAEAPPHAGPEALKAQAIASRSYLLSGPSAHHEYDACDTTHCQYLRSPPSAGSPASLATRATAGMVLTWRPNAESQPAVVRAMYSRSCGGLTRRPSSIPDGTYPYFSVPCDFCRRHPERWSRSNTAAPTSETQRIQFNRIHGWSAVPSNTHTFAGTSREGRGVGHGVGLCQAGAADMAARGASSFEILSRFYPGATTSTLSQ